MMTKRSSPRSLVLTLRSALVLLLLCGAATAMNAQTFLLDNVEFFDAATGKKVKASKPAGITQEQQIIFPSTVGTTGQLLSIASVSGGAMTLGWQTVAVGSAALSDRRTSTETLAPSGTATGVSVSIGANKIYRVEGIILANRVNDAGSPSDNLKFTISGPSGTSLVKLSVRCYDCPNPSGSPTHATVQWRAVSTGAIDPDASGSDFTPRTYGIEGAIKTGVNAGTLRIIVDDMGDASTNSIEMAAESYIVLTEID